MNPESPTELLSFGSRSELVSSRSGCDRCSTTAEAHRISSSRSISRLFPRLTLIAAGCFATLDSPFGFAQGGPPMLTDDPGTPGNRHWEINFAGALEHSSSEDLYEFPAVDINYGAGDHIQLKLEGSWLTRSRSDSEAQTGAGNALAGVKWRFLDEDKDGVSVSIYPQIEWNLASSSVRHGLVEEGTHFILPAEIARRVGPFEFAAEVGYVIGIDVDDEWLVGIVADWPFNEQFEILAELHSDLPSDFGSSQLTANFGARAKLGEHVSLLASLGHDLLSESGGHRGLISYLGFQFTF